MEEARKHRLAARREATRQFTSDLHEADALHELEFFITNRPVYGSRRPDVEKEMALRTAGLLYSGQYPGLRLGAAIGICQGYDKTGFRSLQQHAGKFLTEERISRLNDRCPLDDLGSWLVYSKHLQGNQELLVLSSLGMAHLSFRYRPLLIGYRVCMGVRF